MSAPAAYIGFAIVIDGRIRYFRTKTTCNDFVSWFNGTARGPYTKTMLGEQIVLYEEHGAIRLKRENGDVYEVELSESSTTRSFLLLNAKNVYANTKYVTNSHPEDALRECRRLTEPSERDACLWLQAGHQKDGTVCDEISEALRPKCLEWVQNLLTGRVNE